MTIQPLTPEFSAKSACVMISLYHLEKSSERFVIFFDIDIILWYGFCLIISVYFKNKKLTRNFIEDD